MRVSFVRLLALSLCAGVAACGGDSHVGKEPPPIPASNIVDLGVVLLTPSNQDQTFEVNVDGSSGFVVVADGGDATDIDIELLLAPSGRQLITPSRTDANPLTGNRSPQEVGGSVATAVLTGSATDPIESGTYTIRIASFDGAGVRNSAQVRLTAIINRRLSPATGTLPINVYLVGAPGLSAATASGSEALQVVLDEILGMYGAVGIRVEVAQYKDVVADPATRLAVLDVLDETTDRLVPDRNLNRQSDEMDELFALSEGTETNAINLFLVQEFFTRTNRHAVSGGHPGPSIMQGTVHSGIAASTLGGLDNQSETDLEKLGREIAIEIARYLGAQPTDDQDELTPDQGRVLLRNPAVEGRTPPLEVVDLGTVALSGSTPSGEFQVDATGAVSLTLIADGGNSPALRFSTIVFPSGPINLDHLGAPPTFRPGIPGPAVVALIPNTPLIPLEKGLHRFSLTAVGPAPNVRVTALINRRQNIRAGRLNVNIFLVAAPGLDAESAREDANVRTFLSETERLLRKSGIRLGSVRFRSVPEPDAMRLTLIDNDVELGDLFSLSRTTSNAFLDLFVIRQFTDDPGTLGKAGTIPGPSSVPPTRVSGVAIALFDGLDTPRQARELAHVAVHEASHYLGLYHTTEVDVRATEPVILGVLDPLADTPACRAEDLAPEEPSLASCPDASNVMFPVLLPNIDQSTLTPDQAFVLQRNPLITD